MPPRCFPTQPQHESAAELVLWQALHDRLPRDAVLVANQTFSDRNGDCEADLVVGLPGSGVAVIEVKGGHVTHDGQGWRQSGGGVDKTVDPVRQVRRAHYALRDFLRRHPASAALDLRMTHFVSLPYTRVSAAFCAPDLPRERLLDRGDTEHVVARLRSALDALQTLQRPPSVDDVDALLEALTSRLLPQRDLVAQAGAAEAQCDLLTARQAKILDVTTSLRRVEVRGGAGSGKTWLAVEKARRLARNGERVGLVCYSRGLAAYLQRRVELLPRRERPAYVGTFHALGAEWGAPPSRSDDQQYYDVELPAQMTALAAHLGGQAFDAFLVDEAQDFADAWWPALLVGLRDREHGGLFVFSDEGQRIFDRQGRPPVELTPLDLDENLRNTKQIAQTFGGLTHSQMRYRGGDGRPVRLVACRSEDAVHAADDEVLRLLREGWAAEHVALLTTRRRHPVQEELQRKGADAYWDSYCSGDDVFYGHVLGFKGLERPAVVLAVDGFHDRAKERLYVGLSRARDLLVVCGDPGLLAEVGGPALVDRLRNAAAAG